jgi:hypothetical protein
MINTSLDIRRYKFSINDRLFLDANIWLLIYGPVPRSDKDKFLKNIYSNAFKYMLSNNSQIFVNGLLLSEFINAFGRFEFNRIKPEFEWYNGFKKFRNSPEFTKVAKEIAVQSKKIMDLSSRCDSMFNSMNIDNLLTEYGKGHLDFNDQLYLNLCKANGLILVTNDSDFKNCGVPLLTANPALL